MSMAITRLMITDAQPAGALPFQVLRPIWRQPSRSFDAEPFGIWIDRHDQHPQIELHHGASSLRGPDDAVYVGFGIRFRLVFGIVFEGGFFGSGRLVAA